MEKPIYIAPGWSAYDASRFLDISSAALLKYAQAGRVGTRHVSLNGRVVYRYTKDELERFSAELGPRPLKSGRKPKT